MKTFEGDNSVPVIYSAHHASHSFGEFDNRVALTAEQKIRFSDYGTEDTVPFNGLATIVSTRSRALGDLNRNPDDPRRFQSQDYGKPERHDIWLPGQELTEAEKKFCQRNFYEPYHEQIVEWLAARHEPTFVVAWDNTAHYRIGADEAGEDVIMKPFILSNRGKEGSTDPNDEETSCDPVFMELLVEEFRAELKKHGLPDEVYLNLVFKGGYVTRRYSSLRNHDELEALGITAPIQSLQIEYDTAITHDQQTLAYYPEKGQQVKAAFSTAIERAYKSYIQI